MSWSLVASLPRLDWVVTVARLTEMPRPYRDAAIGATPAMWSIVLFRIAVSYGRGDTGQLTRLNVFFGNSGKRLDGGMGCSTGTVGKPLEVALV